MNGRQEKKKYAKLISESELMTQAEAQGLIQVLKRMLQQGNIMLPQMGNKTKIELCSVFSEKDRFTIIVNRSSRIRADKYTLMLRYGKDKGLLRIDVGGPEHTNPDGTIIPCPHIHIQQNDVSAWDAWATEIPAVFGNVADRIETFKTFLQYCNVNNIASIEICEQSEMGCENG